MVQGWLAQTREQLAAPGAGLEQARKAVAERWAGRFADLLDEDPGVEAALRALVEEVCAGLPSGTVMAAGYSLAAGAGREHHGFWRRDRGGGDPRGRGAAGPYGPRLAVLCGLGGAGKTSVAVEYAHRQLQSGGAGVCWQLQAEDPAVLAAEFAVLAAQLVARDLADALGPVGEGAVLALSASDRAHAILVLLRRIDVPGFPVLALAVTVPDGVR